MADDESSFLSPYAPMRYRELSWWQFALSAVRAGAITTDGRIATDLPEQIMEGVCEPMVREFQEAIKDEPEASDLLGNLLPNVTILRQWVPLAGQFEACGRQIFDLADSLVTVLEQMNIKDATLEALGLPYEAFYMRFGLQEGMRLPFTPEADDPDQDPFEYFEGAFFGRVFLSESTQRLVLGLTTVRRSGRGMLRPGYILDLHPEEQALPALEAIEVALKRRLTNLRAEREGAASASVRAMGVWEAERYEETATLLRAAMPLVLNGLFYLESIEGRHSAGPGRDTPPSLVAEWMNARPEKRHKLRSRLTREGYSVVSLIGTEYEKLLSSGARGTVALHWRKGHVRNQPYGPNRSLRKRIRIDPVLINARNAQPTDEPPGHLYVGPSDTRQ